jgi:predicted Zn-dependent protease
MIKIMRTSDLQISHKLCLSFVSVIALLFLVQCATTGPGGKKSLILLSTDQEVSIGKEMAGQVEKEEKLSADTVLQNYLNNLGQKIAKVSDRPKLQYHFKVIESDQINAFAAPGGYIYFYTGLMKIMDSEAELAAVMGHEISHVVARHGVRRMQQVIGLSILLDLALGKSSAATQQAVGIGIGLMLQGYSRENELESDDYGALYMARAGYNPQAMISMFKKLEGVSKGGANVIEKLTSSHPTPAQRIELTEKNIAKWGYQKSDLPYFPERYKEMKGRIK